MELCHRTPLTNICSSYYFARPYSSNGGVSFGAAGVFSNMAPGSYSIVVRDNNGMQSSKSVVVSSSGTSTVIVGQPESAAVCALSPASFSVTATGAGELTYQWRRAGAEIPGATSATYTILSASSPDAGDYDVVVNGACGIAMTSQKAILAINAPVEILTPLPASANFCEGSRLELSVTAYGSGLNYQWFRNNVPLEGEVNATYSVAEAQSSRGAVYSVVVSSFCDSTAARSDTFVVVNQPAVIAAIFATPAKGVVCEGSPASFRVAATGTLPLRYQWRKDSVPVAGATNAILFISAAVPADAGDYDVIVTSVCGSKTSAEASLTVNSKVVITKHPISQVACAGTDVSFLVEAAGIGLTYQWRKGGVAIGGATTSVLSLPGVPDTDAGKYDVVVSGTCGSISSNPAALEVPDPVASITLDGSTMLCPGGTVRLTANPGVSYLWSDGSTTQDITVAEPGYYSVKVTDPGGCTAVSRLVEVKKLPPPVPTITLVGRSDLCAGTSVSLIASAGAKYLWSNGESSQLIKVSTAGSYFVTVTDDNGCSASSEPVALTVVPAPLASIAVDGSANLCGGASVKLTASAGESYAWSNGATTQSITVADAGVFTVRVANAEGCSTKSEPVSISRAAPAAQPAITGTTITSDGHAVFTILAAGYEESCLTVESFDLLASHPRWNADAQAMITRLEIGRFECRFTISESGRIYRIRASP